MEWTTEIMACNDVDIYLKEPQHTRFRLPQASPFTPK